MDPNKKTHENTVINLTNDDGVDLPNPQNAQSKRANNGAGPGTLAMIPEPHPQIRQPAVYFNADAPVNTLMPNAGQQRLPIEVRERWMEAYQLSGARMMRPQPNQPGAHGLPTTSDAWVRNKLAVIENYLQIAQVRAQARPAMNPVENRLQTTAPLQGIVTPAVAQASQGISGQLSTANPNPNPNVRGSRVQHLVSPAHRGPRPQPQPSPRGIPGGLRPSPVQQQGAPAHQLPRSGPFRPTPLRRLAPAPAPAPRAPVPGPGPGPAPAPAPTMPETERATLQAQISTLHETIIKIMTCSRRKVVELHGDLTRKEAEIARTTTDLDNTIKALRSDIADGKKTQAELRRLLRVEKKQNRRLDRRILFHRNVNKRAAERLDAVRKQVAQLSRAVELPQGEREKALRAHTENLEHLNRLLALKVQKEMAEMAEMEVQEGDGVDMDENEDGDGFEMEDNVNTVPSPAGGDEVANTDAPGPSGDPNPSSSPISANDDNDTESEADPTPTTTTEQPGQFHSEEGLWTRGHFRKNRDGAPTYVKGSWRRLGRVNRKKQKISSIRGKVVVGSRPEPIRAGITIADAVDEAEGNDGEAQNGQNEATPEESNNLEVEAAAE
ncbi:uncharacterized protein DSM5745_09422 [Aspergillus mulundensis]|uniref:Uncharacterized protein n=1 Tax=Aspergillus mulundensis TaxID=1810919 RepID=A0A3D8QUZ8_9EURO|nr:hypothetical protein DSM5745_09422 [Aspergillus mulundensis]RDW65683.1 hypothetical protein DSM5745_09422 [Aspergillus mulundensis]